MAAVAVPGAAGEGVGAQQPHARGELASSAVQTMPPSPTQSCFLEKKLKVLSSPTVPTWRSALSVPGALAALSCGFGPRSIAVESCADRLGAVLDQEEAALVAELAQREHLGGVAAEVHGDDRAGAGCDPVRGVLDVDVEVVPAATVVAPDIAEHGLRADVAGGGGARDEGERGHDHLVARADPGGEVGEVQRGGAAGDRHRVRRADVGGERLLEGLRAGSHRQPAGAQAVEHGLDVLLGHGDVGERHAPIAHRAIASASAVTTRS